MEGLKNIDWRGTDYNWKALFRNYFMNLKRAFDLFILISGDEVNCKEFDCIKNVKVVFKNELFNSLLNTSGYNCFIEDSRVGLIISRLSQKNAPIDKFQLKSYMLMIHSVALSFITQISIKPEYLTHFNAPDVSFERLKQAFNEEDKLQNEAINQDLLARLFHFYDGINVINPLSTDTNMVAKMLYFMKYGYIECYISALESFVFPNWYSVCFSKNCDNSAMWGHYADSHKGVCLIYDLDESDSMNIQTKLGFELSSKGSATIFGKEKFRLGKVSYDAKYDSILFFENLLKVKQKKEIFRSQWFENTHISESDEQRWNENYKAVITKAITTKNKDWEYEQEIRLFLIDYWDDYINDNNGQRVILKYDLSKLKGIVFGVNTPYESKRKIFQIIKNKGRSENNFEFYQAYYDKQTGKIEKQGIPLFELSK
jgi:hypothetical protein